MSSPSPSPSKPKWSPGGAMRRTSTILSMGRSKTPSRSSSVHESDPSPLKGVAAPPPKSKSTLSTGSPSKEPTATPSKSTLSRVGTVLRRPSSLIPRRRTTSTASSFRDGDSTPSKTASALRSSIEVEPAIKPAPAKSQVSESAVPEPSIPESVHISPPVILSTKETQFTDEPEQVPRLGVIEQPPLSISHERAAPTTEEARDEPIASSTADPAPALLVAEPISAEPKAEESSLAPISIAEPTSEQISADREVEEPSIVPRSTAEPVPTALATDPATPLPEADQPTVVFTPTTEGIPVAPTPDLIDSGPSTHSPEAKKQAPVSTFTTEAIPATASAPEFIDPDPATHLPEASKQPAVFTSTTEAILASPPSEHIDPAPEVVEDVNPSPGPATHDVIVEEPLVVAPSSPVVETGLAASTPEHLVAEPLREVSSLNSSFEDLAVSAQPLEDEVVVIQRDAVVDEPGILLAPVHAASVSSETKEEEKVSPVAVMPTTKEPPSVQSTEPILEVTKDGYQPVVVEAPVVPVTQEPQPLQRSLEISTTSVESAAPSPSLTHPLLPIEVQETSVRQSNGILGPVRDHHTKTPQEYRSILGKLLDDLISLIRHWRRCLW
ncbi:hypothetical protein C0995_003955 [Termitomyces sp. Mi166|nr:hypothetical protein C0995_003955 [Termitomyces sp. Mi166\